MKHELWSLKVKFSLSVMMLKWHLERDWDQDLRRPWRWSLAELRPQTRPSHKSGAQVLTAGTGDRAKLTEERGQVWRMNEASWTSFEGVSSSPARHGNCQSEGLNLDLRLTIHTSYYNFLGILITERIQRIVTEITDPVGCWLHSIGSYICIYGL